MKKITLYVVEDYKLIRTAYKHYFSTLNEIELLGDFETAEECIEKMKERTADIILMDLGLPGINGIEATRILKNNYPETKIIILTSHDRNEEIFASLASGANAYALKDMEFDELVNVIKNVNKGAIWIDSEIAGSVLSAFPKPDSTKDIKTLYNKPDCDYGLTERELEVLRLVVDGKSNIEIANIINISRHTAKAHVCKILGKLAVTDRVQAAVKALKHNLY